MRRGLRSMVFLALGWPLLASAEPVVLQCQLAFKDSTVICESFPAACSMGLRIDPQSKTVEVMATTNHEVSRKLSVLTWSDGYIVADEPRASTKGGKLVYTRARHSTLNRATGAYQSHEVFVHPDGRRITDEDMARLDAASGGGLLGRVSPMVRTGTCTLAKPLF